VQRLFRALEPVLIERARAAGCVGGRLTFATGSGTTTHIVVEEHSVTLDRQAGADQSPSLTEADLGHLLFHGYDRVAAARWCGSR